MIALAFLLLAEKDVHPLCLLAPCAVAAEGFAQSGESYLLDVALHGGW